MSLLTPPRPSSKHIKGEKSRTDLTIIVHKFLCFCLYLKVRLSAASTALVSSVSNGFETYREILKADFFVFLESTLFNTASYAAPQVPLCQRMLHGTEP